jgi:hypothetical protein
LLAADDATHASFADLMRVNRIVVERGPSLAAIEGRVPVPWSVAEETAFAVVLTRELPNAHHPGSLSWPLAGFQAEAAAEPSARLETVRISDRDPGVQTVVFARAHWPGYSATFGGVDVPVRAHAGFLVAVDLPAGQTDGDLVLSFTPKGLRPGAAVSSAAALALLGFAAFLHAAPYWPGSVRTRRSGQTAKARPDGT